LEKRGGISSGCFLLTVGQKGEGRFRALVSGVDLCSLQVMLIKLDRGVIYQQR
jgi:hypothetical protein